MQQGLYIADLLPDHEAETTTNVSSDNTYVRPVNSILHEYQQHSTGHHMTLGQQHLPPKY